MFYQEPITQREGALNLCMYADSTWCQMALAQNPLYGKCYVGAIIHLALVELLGIPYMEFSCRCHSITGGITSLTPLPFGLWAPDFTLLMPRLYLIYMKNVSNSCETLLHSCKSSVYLGHKSWVQGITCIMFPTKLLLMSVCLKLGIHVQI